MINLADDPFFKILVIINIMIAKADELLGFKKDRPLHASSKKVDAPYLQPFPKIQSVI